MEPVDGIEATREIRARYARRGGGGADLVRRGGARARRARGGRVRIPAEGRRRATRSLPPIRAAHRGELQLDPADRAAPDVVTRVRLQRGDPTAELTRASSRCSGSSGAGKANKEIAAELEISERTARTHVSNILGKLGLSSRTQAALWAVREGLVDV